MRASDIQKEIDRMTNNRFVTDSIGTMEEQKEFDNKRNYVMTEKLIERLAIEAGIISAEYNGFDPTGLTPAQRKFAELIVRECVQTLIDNTPARYTNESAEEDWDKGYDRAMTDCVHHIQEHFGVE